MAELTHLDEKLGEVLGLAQAAQSAGQRVATLGRHEEKSELVALMERMRVEASEVEERCSVVAGTRDGMKTAINEKAQETKNDVTTFMRTYLKDAEALDGLEFLSMAEAGELIHWEILDTLNQSAKDSDVTELVKFALPIQRGHVDAVREHALQLARAEDPSEPA
jgi:hypothetical protein